MTKKILWLNWRCWLNPAMGGAEVFTREVAERWVALGNEVTLFTSEFPDCNKEEVINGVRIVRAGGRFSVYRQAKKYYAKRFSAEGFDVVIDEINTMPFFAPSFVSKGEKVVALIHQLAREYWFYETPFPISYLGYNYLEEKWLKRYRDTLTVTVSKSSQADLINLGFKHVFVVPEGLNFKPLEFLPTKSDVPVVVYAGRLKPAKRPDHVIKAFNIVREKIPNCELWVIGDGQFRKDLEKMSSGNVQFFGRLESVQRRELIQKAWVLVNPSVREGWGLNVTEANALGVPAVAYSVPGLVDSVDDGKTGLLVAAGNVSALAEGILRLLNNGDLRKQYSEHALEVSKGYSWDNTSKAFMSVIDEN